jgi:hypothetical protein
MFAVCLSKLDRKATAGKVKLYGPYPILCPHRVTGFFVEDEIQIPIKWLNFINDI